MQAGAARDTVFVSHANPEDNRFSRWLALRLARDGYKVWSDLTGLLGGEDIWRDIEHLIRERIIKFLYVLSRSSNQRIGTLQELQIALTVARTEKFSDFVIPLRIDDLPHSEANIQLARLFTTPFSDSWTVGYSMLVEKLKRDGVPTSDGSSPGLVARWWSEHLSPVDGVAQTPEEYLSNWFPITKMPYLIHLHELPVPPPNGMPARRVGVWHSPYLVSFAPPHDIAEDLGDGIPIRGTRTWPTTTFLEGASGMVRRQARDLVYRILRLAWERFVESRGLPIYEMANKAKCGYFTTKLVGENRLPFAIGERRSVGRQLVGHRTRSRRLPGGSFEPVRQYWHFGVEARPLVYPRFAFALHAHVLFSHDGLNIWQSKAALHRARRSACTDWWNDEWRDRLLATMAWLASGNSSITIDVATGTQLEIGCDPVRFQSPISYLDPDEAAARELEIESDDDDEEADG
jgi:hypothetical protein